MITDTPVHLFFQLNGRNLINECDAAPHSEGWNSDSASTRRQDAAADRDVGRDVACLQVLMFPSRFIYLFIFENRTYGHDNKAPNVVSIPAGL